MKTSTSTLFSHLDLARLGLEAKRHPNGAVHVTGPKPQLDQLCAKMAKSPQPVSPTIAMSMQIDGVHQPGFPRIEMHPCHDKRIDLGFRLGQ